MGLIDMIAAERVAIADDIETLDAAQLQMPSLCSEWTVHEVAAHLIMPFEVRLPAFLKGVITHGFSLDRAGADFAKRIAAERDAASIVATLRDNRYHPFKPPGMGLDAPLLDVVVHSQDIRRVVGLSRQFESDTLKQVLSFLVSGKTKGFVSKSLIDGLEFDANDVGWTSGSGALVRGPGELIAMALSGRSVDLSDLEGDGVETLKSRLAQST